MTYIMLAFAVVVAPSVRADETDDGGGRFTPSGPVGDGSGLLTGDSEPFRPGTVNPRYVSAFARRMVAETYQPFVFASNPLTVNAAGIAPIAMWERGGFYASGSRVSMPGLMGRESGALNLFQLFGPLSINASAGAEKYGFFGGLVTTWSLSGDITYTFNDTFSLTVFGSYYANSPYISAAMVPYVGTSVVGGYLGINFSDHWGVDVGAQSVYQPWRNGWDTRPIVAPYYKFDNGTKLQVDVGGILYELLRDGNSSRSNPTMGPPVYMGPPPVAPRK